VRVGTLNLELFPLSHGAQKERKQQEFVPDLRNNKAC